jgi:hypothetical protein
VHKSKIGLSLACASMGEDLNLVFARERERDAWYSALGENIDFARVMRARERTVSNAARLRMTDKIQSSLRELKGTAQRRRAESAAAAAAAGQGGGGGGVSAAAAAAAAAGAEPEAPDVGDLGDFTGSQEGGAEGDGADSDEGANA